MNTQQLECFVQVASNLSFRRAAQELHISQPTVSKQVATLEEELGGELFVRTTRSVALTALGESFLPNAQEILRLMYASAERSRRQASGASLAIGYSDPSELAALAPALESLHGENPSLSVSLRIGARDDNIEKLARGQLDVVLGFKSSALDTEDIAFVRLRQDRLACLLPADSPLAGRPHLSQTDVAGMPQVIVLPTSLHRRGYIAQADIPRIDERLVTHCLTTQEAVCLVEAGYGYALAPGIQTLIAQGRCAVVPWEGSTSADYGAYHRTRDEQPLAKRFLAIAKIVYGKD